MHIATTTPGTSALKRIYMKLTLLLIGKTSFPYINEGLSIYKKRVSIHIPFNLVELPDVKGAASLTKEQIRQKEGEAMLRYVKNTDTFLLLDERGESFTSLQWAAYLERQMIVNPGRDITFAIGGAYGFSLQVYERADGKVSLSKMTFSHQIVRLLFMEQLYRAFTIIKGEPYHHQ